MKKYILMLLFAIFCVYFIWCVKIVGPYLGTVTDSKTGMPLEGASVLIYWMKDSPNAGGGFSEFLGAALGYTGNKGKYHIPFKYYHLDPCSFLGSTYVVIYEPGYKVYIASPWDKPPAPFKKRNNIVKLERIPSDFSHKDHVENIERALGNIEMSSSRYNPEDKIDNRWKVIVETGLKSGMTERSEFLRRVEWEERRQKGAGK